MSNPTDPEPGALPAPRSPRDTQPIPLLAHPGQPGAADPQATVARPVRGAEAQVPAPPEPAAPAEASGPGLFRSMPGPWLVLGSVALAIVIWAGATILRKHPAAGPGAAPAAAADQPPPPLRAYYDRASNGDVSAMRMLGTMYYNGLNVPQDMKEGVRWYRKAAAAGSVAAAKDLEQLGLTVKEP